MDYRPRATDTWSAPRVLLTCEHASEDLPRPYRWTSEDAARLGGTHWTYAGNQIVQPAELAETDWETVGTVRIAPAFIAGYQ